MRLARRWILLVGIAVLTGCQAMAVARPVPEGTDKRTVPSLDSALRRAVESGRDPATLPQARRWRFDGQGRLRVEVRFRTALDAGREARLRALGLDIDLIAADRQRAEGWAAWSALTDLAREPDVRQVTPARPAIPQ